jgi:hypothetical protein
MKNSKAWSYVKCISFNEIVVMKTELKEKRFQSFLKA